MRRTPGSGSWAQRWLIYTFTVVLGILVYWLLGFIVNDIGSIRGPDYRTLEESRLDATLNERARELRKTIEQAEREIKEQQARQKILRDSTTNSQTTMNQLLDLQRLSLTKGGTPSEEERKALGESQQLFLANQREYQRLNERVAQLSERLQSLNEEQRTNQAELEEARGPIRADFSEQLEQHKIRIAVLKLSFLVPLLAVAAFLYARYRTSTYWAIIYAFAAAVVIKVGFVMHEYFPTRYFKYVLIFATLAVALRVIVYLLRSAAFPQKEALLRQYREAYESFLCPICSHPIRRGPLRFMAWTRRTITRHSAPLAGVTDDDPYTCPACSTSLYATCASCGKTRHALLPACQHCGAELDLDG